MEALKPPNKLTRAPNKLMSLVFMAQSKPDKKYIHMVRNHQDGYPYINLALFLSFWKYPETSIFLVKIIGRWIPDGEGRGSTRNIFKNIFFFSTSTKKVTMLGPFKRLKYREGSREKLHIFFFWKNPEISIFLVKLNGQWILNREGRGEVRNIWKNYFHSQTLQN